MPSELTIPSLCCCRVARRFNKGLDILNAPEDPAQYADLAPRLLACVQAQDYEDRGLEGGTGVRWESHAGAQAICNPVYWNANYGGGTHWIMLSGLPNASSFNSGQAVLNWGGHSYDFGCWITRVEAAGPTAFCVWDVLNGILVRCQNVTAQTVELVPDISLLPSPITGAFTIERIAADAVAFQAAWNHISFHDPNKFPPCCNFAP